jgi:hypothetical protein
MTQIGIEAALSGSDGSWWGEKKVGIEDCYPVRRRGERIEGTPTRLSFSWRRGRR